MPDHWTVFFFLKNMAPTIPIMQLEPLSDITGVYYVQLPREPQKAFYYFVHICGSDFQKPGNTL